MTAGALCGVNAGWGAAVVCGRCTCCQPANMPTCSAAARSPCSCARQFRHCRQVHTKGSGKTPFSRGHDGRLLLREAVHEVLMAEALARLGVPPPRPSVSSPAALHDGGLYLGLIRTGSIGQHFPV